MPPPGKWIRRMTLCRSMSKLAVARRARSMRARPSKANGPSDGID
ncbi:hypothetical protein OSI99_14675 [Mycobacterium ulcerans]